MITADPGRVTVVVGPNGAGKSALGHWLQTHAGGSDVRRLIAHRRLWFEYAGPGISSAERESTRANVTLWSEPESRWLDHAHAQRASIVLFDLLASVNERNARLAHMYKEGASREEIDAAIEGSPLDRVNSIAPAVRRRRPTSPRSWTTCSGIAAVAAEWGARGW